MKKCFVSIFSFIIATILMIYCCSCGNNNDDSSQSKNIEPKIIYEENGLSIYYKGYTEKNNGVGLDLLIENNSDKSYTIQTRDFYINGYSVQVAFSPNVKAGKKANDDIRILKSELEKNELSYSKVEDIEFNFHVFNSDEWSDSFDSPTISLKNHDSNISKNEIEKKTNTDSSFSITSSMEYAEKISDTIQINDIETKFGEMIGALDGCCFKYNELTFELYMFAENSEELEKAKQGVFSFTIEGFGDFTMNSKVNGNFVLLYNTENDDVIDAFYNVK